MSTKLGLTPKQWQAYHERLFASHDFRINAQILSMEERVLGDLAVLDGQINFQPGSGVRRTATLTVSDPAGALDFTGAQQMSGSSVWLDRLIRVRHTLKVPGVGLPNDEVTATCFIGPPSTFSRNGAEVDVELQDKSSLAMRGTKPYSVHKGAHARNAIRAILRDCCGEFRFALGSSSRRLSKPYGVGWDDKASPWAVASKIAREQLGLQLYYSADGYASLRRLPSAPSLTVPYVVDAQASTSVDFTTISNFVQVTGHQQTSTKDAKKGSGLPQGSTITKTSQVFGSATLKPGHALSPQSLARKGIPRYLPELVSDDSITKKEQAATRAANELGKVAKLHGTPNYDVVPFFHADPDDVVKIRTPEGDRNVRLSTVSIPLGVSGPMTIGMQRLVSRAPRSSTRSWIVRTRKVQRPKHHHKGK